MIQKFFCYKVCDEAAYFSAVQSSKNVCIVYKTTAGNVDNSNSVLHVLDRRCINHSLCVVCLWNVEC